LTFAVLHSSMATSTVAAMGGDGDARGATQLKYNGTGATGANPLEMDVNIWYEVSSTLPFPSHQVQAPSAHCLWTPALSTSGSQGVPQPTPAS
jgi:hypothetical protein